MVPDPSLLDDDREPLAQITVTANNAGEEEMLSCATAADLLEHLGLHARDNAAGAWTTEVALEDLALAHRALIEGVTQLLVRTRTSRPSSCGWVNLGLRPLARRRYVALRAPPAVFNLATRGTQGTVDDASLGSRKGVVAEQVRPSPPPFSSAATSAACDGAPDDSVSDDRVGDCEYNACRTGAAGSPADAGAATADVGEEPHPSAFRASTLSPPGAGDGQTAAGGHDSNECALPNGATPAAAGRQTRLRSVTFSGHTTELTPPDAPGSHRCDDATNASGCADADGQQPLLDAEWSAGSAAQAGAENEPVFSPLQQGEPSAPADDNPSAGEQVPPDLPAHMCAATEREGTPQPLGGQERVPLSPLQRAPPAATPVNGGSTTPGPSRKRARTKRARMEIAAAGSASQ